MKLGRSRKLSGAVRRPPPLTDLQLRAAWERNEREAAEAAAGRVPEGFGSTEEALVETGRRRPHLLAEWDDLLRRKRLGELTDRARIDAFEAEARAFLSLPWKIRVKTRVLRPTDTYEGHDGDLDRFAVLVQYDGGHDGPLDFDRWLKICQRLDEHVRSLGLVADADADVDHEPEPFAPDGGPMVFTAYWDIDASVWTGPPTPPGSRAGRRRP